MSQRGADLMWKIFTIQCARQSSGDFCTRLQLQENPEI